VAGLSKSDRRHLSRLLEERDGEYADPDTVIDSTLSVKENISELGLPDSCKTSNIKLRESKETQFDTAAGEAIGLNYSSGPIQTNKNFKVLPQLIKSKRTTITINAPILTNNEQLKLAALTALKHTAEMIRTGVTSANKNVFADHPGHFSISQYGTEDYYASGMIPYWEGGLLGSFSIIEAYNLTVEMAFISPYAKILEEGGVGTGASEDWSKEKDAPSLESGRKVRVHPFVGSVANKIDENMQTFGYLSPFSNSFIQNIR
jgi:hypothetical protein